MEWTPLPKVLMARVEAAINGSKQRCSFAADIGLDSNHAGLQPKKQRHGRKLMREYIAFMPKPDGPTAMHTLAVAVESAWLLPSKRVLAGHAETSTWARVRSSLAATRLPTNTGAGDVDALKVNLVMAVSNCLRNSRQFTTTWPRLPFCDCRSPQNCSLMSILLSCAAPR